MNGFGISIDLMAIQGFLPLQNAHVFMCNEVQKSSRNAMSNGVLSRIACI